MALLIRDCYASGEEPPVCRHSFDGSECVFGGAPLAHEVRIGLNAGSHPLGRASSWKWRVSKRRSGVVQRGFKAQLRHSLMAGLSSAAFSHDAKSAEIEHAERWARRDPAAGTCRWFSTYLCCMAAKTRVHR